MRSVIVGLLLIGFAGHAYAAGEPMPVSTPHLDVAPASQSRQRDAFSPGRQEDWPSLLAGEQIAACCKICRKGKACGDSCIKKTNTCHKGKGCACDAE